MMEELRKIGFVVGKAHTFGWMRRCDLPGNQWETPDGRIVEYPESVGEPLLVRRLEGLVGPGS